MNEMASELEWHIAHNHGITRTDIRELNHALRRVLRNRGGNNYARPIELAHQHLAAPNPTGSSPPPTNI
jgi:hypothetical protein